MAEGTVPRAQDWPLASGSDRPQTRSRDPAASVSNRRIRAQVLMAAPPSRRSREAPRFFRAPGGLAP